MNWLVNMHSKPPCNIAGFYFGLCLYDTKIQRNLLIHSTNCNYITFCIQFCKCQIQCKYIKKFIYITKEKERQATRMDIETIDIKYRLDNLVVQFSQSNEKWKWYQSLHERPLFMSSCNLDSHAARLYPIICNFQYLFTILIRWTESGSVNLKHLSS